MIALLAALALVPTPIGPGRAYAPLPDRALEVCSRHLAYAVHLELFANGRALVIPTGIGSCSDAARTRTPTGVVELARRDVSLGELFRVWRQPLDGRRMLSFRSRALANRSAGMNS